jgi:Rrf2 family protein
MAMKITQEADYGLRVVLFLSKLNYGEKIEARSIAEQEHVPIRFLLKILRKLTHAGIINSYRGVNGGYSLNMTPNEISLKDVIEIIDGPIYVNRCTYDESFCTANRTSVCEVHKAMVEVQSVLSDILSKKNFADLIDKKQ